MRQWFSEFKKHTIERISEGIDKTNMSAEDIEKQEEEKYNVEIVKVISQIEEKALFLIKMQVPSSFYSSK
jgi:CMP-2-keto-3-deoxyoctulosonic acid synthetase